MSKQKSLVNKFLICIFVVSIFLVFSNTNGVAVYGGSVFGPALVKPDTFPIAPWDTIEIIFNTTDLEYPIQNASFFYTFKDSEAEEPTEWEDFERVNMNLESGDNYTGTWSYELLPRHKNGTTLYYFASLIDENGYDHSDRNSPDTAYEIKILYESPSFEIQNFHILQINEKNLTCNVRFTVYMRGTYNLSENIYFILTNIGDSDILTVKGTGIKGEYFENFEANLQLSGDASYFPFDTPYELQLTFRAISGESGPTLHSESEKIDLLDFNDRTRWKVELVNKRTVDNKYLDLSVSFSRKNENIYFFLIPLLVSYFLLGGSHLLPIEKDQIRNRLTINLTIFVFIIGSFSTNQIIRDMIPSIAIGATTFETAVFSLALYSAVFVIFSLLSNFYCSDEKHQKYGLVFDFIAVLIVLILFFVFPIVDITLLTKETSEIRTLYQHINNQLFAILILVGLSYGFILRSIKAIYLLFKKTENQDTKPKKQSPENKEEISIAQQNTVHNKETKKGAELPEDTILSLIRLIDSKKKKLFRWYDAFHGWSTLIFILVALYIVVTPIMLTVSPSDKAFLLLSLVAVVAALLALYVPFTKDNIINKNYQRLEKEVNENEEPLLRALLKMKAENTDFDLEQIYDMNPDMFTHKKLLEKLYE